MSIELYLEGLPFLLCYMICPDITQVLLAAVAPIYDHPISKSNSCMAVPDWRPGALHIWGVPGMGVYVKHSDVIQVWL